MRLGEARINVLDVGCLCRRLGSAGTTRRTAICPQRCGQGGWVDWSGGTASRRTASWRAVSSALIPRVAWWDVFADNILACTTLTEGRM